MFDQLDVDSKDDGLLDWQSTINQNCTFGHRTPVRSVAFSPDGKLVASGSTDRTIRIWDVKCGSAVASCFGHYEAINSVAFSPGGIRVASGSQDSTICVWNARSGTLIAGPFKGHDGPINSIRFSPDGTCIISGSSDLTIRVWNADNGATAVGPLYGHFDSIQSVAFSPDSTRIASGSYDCNIRMWDSSSGASMGAPFEGHTDWVNSVAFSPDSTRIVSGSADKSVCVWDVHGIASPVRLLGHDDPVQSVAFSPNGMNIISGADGGVIIIWNILDGIPIGMFQPHRSAIHSISFSLDGSQFASASDDGQVMMYDVPEKNLPAKHNGSDNLGLTSMNNVQPAVEVVSSEMSISQMFECLVNHGCVNMSIHMDPKQYSSGAVVGGGFGDIWRGKLRDGTDVAIKVWRFSSVPQDGPKPMKRAMREIYNWSKAKHENIQELMGVLMFQGRLGMVSLWMEHGNLREYIRKYPNANRCSLCVQVAAGLSYLHGQHMVHGDLKAMNILVSQDNVAKLSDFDHSILSECTLIFSETTNPGGGTLRWMAPELLLSSEEEGSLLVRRNKRTDVYALGMTILEIITGQLPYAEYKNDQGVYRALDKRRPPARPTALLGPDEGEVHMWELLMQCWDHCPRARPSSLQVLEKLESLAKIRAE